MRAFARSLSETPRVCAAAVRRVVLDRKLWPWYWCGEPAAGVAAFCVCCAGDVVWLPAVPWFVELPVPCTHPATSNAAIVSAETIRIAKLFSVMINPT